MPTYEYECTKCGYHFDVFQSINDKPKKKCPECGKGVKRLILGGAGVIFKGSGFYVTDNSVSSRKTEKSSSEKSSDTKSSSEKPASEKSGNNTKPETISTTEKKSNGSESQKNAKSAKKEPD